MILAALLAFASPVAVHAAPVQREFAGVMNAVDACLVAIGPRDIDTAKLSALGWTEHKIDGMEQSKDPYRLFAGGGAGAVILFGFSDGAAPYCRVLVARTPRGTDPLASAIASHLGGAYLPGDQGLGGGTRVMRVPGRPFILALRPDADNKDVMADIHILLAEEDK